MRIRIEPFLSMRIRIQIQGCDDQNLENLQLKFCKLFFDQKLQFTFYPEASIKAVQATGDVFIPHKRTSSTSKLEFSSLLWVILALLDPDPYSQCGSGSSRPK
jgi:hypothetical protein